MNFLALAQRLAVEADRSSVGLTTVLNQTGDSAAFVNWIGSAYEDIQNRHVDWRFLETEFTFNTVAAQQAYTPTQIGLTEFGEWKGNSFRVYLTSAGVNGEIDLVQCGWDRFRDTYLRSSLRAQTSQPYSIAQKPDKSLILWPTPNAIYTINGTYFKKPQTMTANTDEPIFPAKYHMAIVWRALMFYAGRGAAPELYAVGEREFKTLMQGMEQTQLPQLQIGGAL